jgi:hypothetical protein
MNPYASDLQGSIESPEQVPPGLSFATVLASLIMLLFGLVSLTSLAGALMNVAQMRSMVPATSGQTTAESSSDGPSVSPVGTLQPTSDQVTILVGTGILDFLLGILMIVWSIQVLQRKPAAAMRLSNLAMLMAILEIPRGILTFYVLKPILEGTKWVVLDGLEKQSDSEKKPSPEAIEFIFQAISYSAIGCVGVILIFAFVVYLFCFFQLRKSTTLAPSTA